MAQWIRRLPSKQKIVGSTPTSRNFFVKTEKFLEWRITHKMSYICLCGGIGVYNIGCYNCRTIDDARHWKCNCGTTNICGNSIGDLSRRCSKCSGPRLAFKSICLKCGTLCLSEECPSCKTK